MARPPNNKKMTVTEAAAYLGVSNQKVTRMLKEGTLKFTIDPLDKRRKLVWVKELDELKETSLNEGKTFSTGSM